MEGINNMLLEFDTKVDRIGLATIREETTPEDVEKAGLISLWGAEFEFKMPSFLIDAIKDWVDKGLVAYSYADDKYLSLVKDWMKLHRNWEIEEDFIVPTYGHTHSMGTICRAFSNPGDGVIGLGPVYHTTWKPVKLNDRIHIDCPLLFDGENYSIDYEALEQIMAFPKNKILAFCNPQNPIAKVWGKEDLRKIAELAYKYDVIIYSDEIFADTVYEGVEMLTFSQVTDLPVKWIVGTSLGKTFSMTGIAQANMIIGDKALREAFVKQRDIDHYGSFNPLMRAAYFAGYTEQGSKWIKEMMQYCYENYLFVDQFVKNNISQMKVIKPEGTYILWIDCRGFGLESDEEYQQFFEKAKFICDFGTTYGGVPGFIRINLAEPRKELEKVFQALKEYVRTNN
jgi:cysteine-S-conjugate beta-lyase